MTSTFDKETLTKMLFIKNYSFTDSPFEPSSDKPIDKDKLTLEELAGYLNETYQTCDKPHIHLKKIQKIIGSDRAQDLIKLNKSEYLKVLTHFTILSKVKRGWVNLLANSPTTISKPSLSNNPSAIGAKDSKKVNDAIILCFYSRLLEGMTKQDKELYQILLPVKYFPTGFDRLLFSLDKAIQDLFCFEKQKLDGYDESLLPDTNLDEAIIKTFNHLYHFLKLTVKKHIVLILSALRL